jgi:hypothetical protein
VLGYLGLPVPEIVGDGHASDELPGGGRVR